MTIGPARPVGTSADERGDPRIGRRRDAIEEPGRVEHEVLAAHGDEPRLPLGHADDRAVDRGDHLVADLLDAGVVHRARGSACQAPSSHGRDPPRTRGRDAQRARWRPPARLARRGRRCRRPATSRRVAGAPACRGCVRRWSRTSRSRGRSEAPRTTRSPPPRSGSAAPGGWRRGPSGACASLVTRPRTIVRRAVAREFRRGCLSKPADRAYDGRGAREPDRAAHHHPQTTEDETHDRPAADGRVPDRRRGHASSAS